MKYFLGIIIFIACAILIYESVWLPYLANKNLVKYHTLMDSGKYDYAAIYLQRAIEVTSPFISLEARKRAGWRLMQELEKGKTDPELVDYYNYLAPELEKFMIYRPADPQIYYVLGRMHRLANKYLNQDSLLNSEVVLKLGMEQSNLRLEYILELADTLIAEKKVDEASVLLANYNKLKK